MMKCDSIAFDDLLDAEDDIETHNPEVARHLETCTHCQSRLAGLAADAEQWDETRHWLSTGDVNDPVYAESLEARERWKRPIAWNDAMAKSLLSAASHPEMLGRIGRYDVERLIGSGGMGVVFKAYDTELNRPVAVKLLAPYLASSGAARSRFAREARAAAAVVDDHVVPIHNVETDDEHPFLVMKYIAGGSLQQRLDRDGPLEVCEVLRIGMQTAKGLAAAHAQGLIHRDVKPSNILLDEGVDRALLTDFGLARATDDASLTRSGFHPGTPHYMSPEQVRGEAIDGRSDLFGLGCVLYALCTGHPPFRSETSYAVLRRITDDTPRPIRETNTAVPEWLEQIVMKLLAKSPDDRFDSAEQVAELLEDCLAHVQQPTTVPLPAPVAELAKSSRISRSGKPAGSLGGFRFPPIGKLIAAAAFAFSLIFAGVLIVLETNKGTLTIESDVDDVPIRIMQGDKVVERLTISRAGEKTRIAAGNYVVAIDGGFASLTVSGNVTLTRGSNATVKIEKSAQDLGVANTNVSSLIDQSAPATFLTADQAIKNGKELADSQKKVVVRFLVLGAELAERVGSYSLWELRSTERLELFAPEKQFTIELSTEVNAELKRLGIDDLEKHYVGKLIEVEGAIFQFSRIGFIGGYGISVRSLGQIRIVDLDNSKNAPVEAGDDKHEANPGTAKVSGIEQPLDRQNARAVVEAYVAAMIAGDIAKAASLAKGDPADRKQIESMGANVSNDPGSLKRDRLALKSVLFDEAAMPTIAIAVSGGVDSFGRGEFEGVGSFGPFGFLVLTLNMSEEGWFVTDVDWVSEKSPNAALKRFLEAYPNAANIPPIANGPQVNAHNEDEKSSDTSDRVRPSGNKSTTANLTLVDAVKQFNWSSLNARQGLFNPPIPDLTIDQFRDAILSGAYTNASPIYQSVSDAEVNQILHHFAETGDLPFGLRGDLTSPVDTYERDTDGQITLLRTLPRLTLFQDNNTKSNVLNSGATIDFDSLELIFQKDGSSSKRYGDPDLSETAKKLASPIEKPAVSLTSGPEFDEAKRIADQFVAALVLGRDAERKVCLASSYQPDMDDEHKLRSLSQEITGANPDFAEIYINPRDPSDIVLLSRPMNNTWEERVMVGFTKEQGKWKIYSFDTYDEQRLLQFLKAFTFGHYPTIDIRPTVLTPTLETAAEQFNRQTADVRERYFNPPIADLTVQRLKTGILASAATYEANGNAELAKLLTEFAETGVMPLGVRVKMIRSGSKYTLDRFGALNLRQFVPTLVIESNDSAEPTYIQIESLELISHEKDGPSSKSYGDPGLRSYSEKALDFEMGATGVPPVNMPVP